MLDTTHIIRALFSPLFNFLGITKNSPFTAYSFHRIIYNAIESLVSPLNNNKVGQVFDNVIQVSLTVTISIHFLQNIQLTTSMDYNWY